MTVMDSSPDFSSRAGVAVIGASADANEDCRSTGVVPRQARLHRRDLSDQPEGRAHRQTSPATGYVASLPEAPDVGIVLLGAERAHLAVRELAQRGTAAAIVLASGYTETGEVGAQRQKQLIEAAGSMRILGPNTTASST
jgi:hypothetical protein